MLDADILRVERPAMVTFAQLRQASGETLRGAADGARKMAREFEQHGGDTDTYRRSMTAAWEGADSAAAGERLSGIANRYRGVAGSFAKLDSIASTLAQNIDRSRSLLESAVSSAPGIPGSVDAQGTVHIDQAALGSSPSAATVAMARQRAEQVAGQIRQALTLANNADSQARQQLGTLAPVSGAAPASPAGSVPARGTDPAAVKKWWDGLSAAQREDLIAADPKQIGGLDGVPVAVRDRANRLALSSELDDVTARRDALKQRVDGMNPGIGDRGDFPQRAEYSKLSGELRDLDQRADNLQTVRDQLSRTDMQGSTEKLYLVDYDSAADGKLVMSVGNPDTANNVVTYVPGMTTDVEHIGANIDRSLRMQADAVAANPNASTASVMWLGYDAPDGVLGAAGDGSYEHAQPDLRSFQEGLRATHQGAPSLNTLLGHSYGSTTVGYAASQGGLGIDNLVMVASPGSTVDNAGDFPGLTADHVWAARGSDDIIQYVPEFVHGNDPVDADFGGRVFPGGDGGHSSYWDPGNPARGNIANIVTGQYDRVPPAMQDPGLFAPVHR